MAEMDKKIGEALSQSVADAVKSLGDPNWTGQTAAIGTLVLGLMAVIITVLGEVAA